MFHRIIGLRPCNETCNWSFCDSETMGTLGEKPWRHWARLKICCDFAQIVCVSGFDLIGFGAE